MHQAVFLDRDGVLNRCYLHADGKTHPPLNPQQVEILPDAADSCLKLRLAGYHLFIVTNQPDVARGTQFQEIVEAINHEVLHALNQGVEQALAAVESINQHITETLKAIEAISETLRGLIDAVMVCYHDKDDNCNCRKPKPGLLIQAAKTWQVDLEHSFMIGDRWTDIEAGRRAGCKTILVNALPIEAERAKPDFYATSLSDATNWILQQ